MVVWREGPRCVTDRHILQLVIAFEVKGTPRRSEQGYSQGVSVSLVAPIVLRPQDAIKTSLDMGEAERTEESFLNSVATEPREGWVFRHPLRAFAKFKPTNSES